MRAVIFTLVTLFLAGTLNSCSVFSPTVARSTTVVKPKTYKRTYEPGKDKSKQGVKKVKMY